MEVVLQGVTALWPRLNRPYRFDQTERRSVPCGALEDGAEYTLQFEMNDDQFAELENKCREAWVAYCKENNINEAPANKPYKKNDAGLMEGKAKLKAAYSGEATQPPRQWDAENKRLPEDFMLTTGSKVNVHLSLIAYKTGMASGVSLRIKNVQVVELAESMGGESPFAKTQGFTSGMPVVEAASELYKAEPKAATAPAMSDPLADDDIPF